MTREELTMQLQQWRAGSQVYIEIVGANNEVYPAQILSIETTRHGEPVLCAATRSYVKSLVPVSPELRDTDE